MLQLADQLNLTQLFSFNYSFFCLTTTRDQQWCTNKEESGQKAKDEKLKKTIIEARITKFPRYKNSRRIRRAPEYTNPEILKIPKVSRYPEPPKNPEMPLNPQML
jgi:hypothetical protein